MIDIVFTLYSLLFGMVFLVVDSVVIVLKGNIKHMIEDAESEP